LITQHDTLKAAAIVGLIASIVISARSMLEGRPKLLELGAVLAFVGFTVASFIADPSATQWLERYARAIAAFLLALIAFSSRCCSSRLPSSTRGSRCRGSFGPPRASSRSTGS
jgi:hypothetical protein